MNIVDFVFYSESVILGLWTGVIYISGNAKWRDKFLRVLKYFWWVYPLTFMAFIIFAFVEAYYG